MCSNPPRKVIVRIEYDHDLENPCEWDGWKVYSFSNRHASYQHPEKLGLDEHGQPNIGLRRKLQVGTAFLLSYYEHGQCVWSLKDTGPQCRWDSVSLAGLLVWEGELSNLGAKTYEAREKDAEAFIRCYTDWCNGTGYGFTIDEADDGEHIESCWGFLGDSGAKDMIAEYIKPAVVGREYEVVGDAAYVME